MTLTMYTAMVYEIVPPSLPLRAEITLPSSKSISNRVLLMDALGSSKSVLLNISDCDDTRVMLRALRSDEEVVDIMAAGTAMRFLTAYYAATEGSHLLTGTERMRQRPIHALVDALRALGAKIDYAGREGFPPLRIEGRQLKGGMLEMPGSISSQYVSALLMAAPCFKEGLRLKLAGEVISKPYILLTMRLMHDFGVEASWEGEDTIVVPPSRYKPVRFVVEADWSAASYWYEMAALAEDAEIKLSGLFKGSGQGDSKVAELFRMLGVETQFVPGGVVLEKQGAQVASLEYDFTGQPDLAQTFVVACALKGIPFRFTGLQSLRIKETDRISALVTEMGKLGYVLEPQGDSVLSWDGRKNALLPSAVPAIDTYEDHRMAMAFAPACLKLPKVRINAPQVVSKSYPSYWEDLRQAGFSISER